MHFTFRNVNDAFFDLVKGIDSGDIKTVRTPSRVGEVLQIIEPVIITYLYPHERVLFNQTRDCNPFFHLFESLWMLAGRNDVAPLRYYNSQIENYSDNGETFNGAYGYRWRYGVGLDNHAEYSVDQLRVLIDHLAANPNSRRAVLQMWNVEDDLLKIGGGVNQSGNYHRRDPGSRDVCCNTCVYFSIRTETLREGTEESIPYVHQFLDMTVCNRSNDLVWGALGANVVHLSFLQEYMATCIGVGVGVYNQFSNNLHAYTERWEPDKWLDDWSDNSYETPEDSALFSLVKDPEVFDREVVEFIDLGWTKVWREPFLDRVAAPMCCAFALHKDRKYQEALQTIDKVQAEDWRIAGRNWIEKRRRNWEKKNA